MSDGGVGVPGALKIDGTIYFGAEYVTREAGVTRQTLWRWRREAKIPPGHRYRDPQVVFTEAEVAQIRAYAQRVVPITR